MRLEGTLDAFSLPDIFQLLSFTQKTGTLHLRREGAHGAVHLRAGSVTGGRADMLRQELGRRLLGTGLVDDEVLAAAAEELAGDATLSLAQLLAEKGRLDVDTVRDLAAEQAHDAVFSLLRWPDGEFAFVVDESDPDDLGALLPVDQVVAEGQRRLAAWGALVESVPARMWSSSSTPPRTPTRRSADVVRRPDGAGPCAGTLLANVSTSGSFRGWTFDGTGPVPAWSGGDDIKQNGFSGTYYVSEGDARNPASNSGPPVPNLTVIASAVTTTPALSCTKVGGNITWGSTDPLAPSVPNTWLIADQDLKTTSNYQAGSASGGTVISGLFIAGDQVEMSTSSNGAYGSVVAADQCDPATGSIVDDNVIKNQSIFYDPNAQAPFTDVINNTLWLEYAG